MLITGSAAYGVWDAFFRYQAFGIVTGNIVDVSAGIDGPIRYLHAGEGDVVEHGQALVTLADLETEQQLERIQDELRVAEATLHADIARLKWNIDLQLVESDEAVAEYLRELSALERESAGLLQRQNELRRSRSLSDVDAVTSDQLEIAEISADGQQRHVQALQQSVEEFRNRAGRVRRLVRPGNEQIRPAMAKIDALVSELSRLQERLKQRDITSPVQGKVLRRYGSVGERSSQAETLFSILEGGSLLIELFVPQRQSKEFAAGDEVQLDIAPHRSSLLCEVVRLGDELVPAPKAIDVYYEARVPLVCVYLRPILDRDVQPSLRVGSVVRLRRQWN